MARISTGKHVVFSDPFKSRFNVLDFEAVLRKRLASASLNDHANKLWGTRIMEITNASRKRWINKTLTGQNGST